MKTEAKTRPEGSFLTFRLLLSLLHIFHLFFLYGHILTTFIKRSYVDIWQHMLENPIFHFMLLERKGNIVGISQFYSLYCKANMFCTMGQCSYDTFCYWSVMFPPGTASELWPFWQHVTFLWSAVAFSYLMQMLQCCAEVACFWFFLSLPFFHRMYVLQSVFSVHDKLWSALILML